MIRFDQSCSILFIFVQSCTFLSILVQLCLFLFILVSAVTWKQPKFEPHQPQAKGRPGVDITKLLYVVSHTLPIKIAEVFVSGKHFQPRLMFAGKAGAYPRLSTPWQALGLRSNIRLDWRGLLETNTPAYYKNSSVTYLKVSCRMFTHLATLPLLRSQAVVLP